MAFTAKVSKGNTVKNQSVTNGGKQYIYGSAYNTKIIGAYQYIESGGHADKTIISGGLQRVYIGAAASNTHVKAKGSQILSGGKFVKTRGLALNTTVSSGGSMQVYSSCLASSPTISAGGSLTVHAGGSANSLTLKSSATLSLTGGATVTGKTNASSASLIVAGMNNKMGSLTTNANTKLTVNITKLVSASVKGSYQSALSFNTKSTLAGNITIAMDDLAGSWGNHLIVQNATIKDQAKITLKIGSKNITTKYHAKYQNVSYVWWHGNNYVVHGANDGFITVSIHGKWHTRNHKYKNDLTKSSDGYYHYSGTSENDLIYAAGNTKFNDKIALMGGNDIVVYDTSKWGKDIIQKTSGNCVLLFKDLAAKDVTKKLSGSTMTITKKSDAKQSITIQGWNSNQHRIVFSSGLSAINKYINTATPTAGICTSAYNEGFNKVGLATCAVKMSGSSK